MGRVDATTGTVTLEESYARCRELNKRHGTTYYWSTQLLPAVKRHHVHALYGLCRYADDIVDDLGSTATTAEREEALTAFGDRLFSALAAGRRAGTAKPAPKRAWLTTLIRGAGLLSSLWLAFRTDRSPPSAAP